MTDDTTATDSSNHGTATIPPILRGIHSTTSGPALLTQILTSKILLVGSGGIGCELLKNLALSGFRNVEIIDLDTIDVSNLNRQFLFRSQHVGMAKCVVASQAALSMVPPLSSSSNNIDTTHKVASYTPHHGNVCDNSRFNVPYMQQFSLVLNALDNVAARRRVNRLCLAAQVPLIEAGTAGYLGQVTVIDKASGTECYECQAKATQKVYPICTIRSTPSMPVHCIVWGKELYKLCFGPKVEESMLFEDEESLRAENDADDAEKNEEKTDKEEGDNDKDSSNDEDPSGEKSTYMDYVNNLRSLMGIGASPSSSSSSSSSLPQSNEELESQIRSTSQQSLTALFRTEIEKQIGMDRYKTADKVPKPLSISDLETCIDDTQVPPTQTKGYQPTQIWSPAECILELTSCFLEIAQMTSKEGTQPLPEFDKDDPLAMRFVTASSNLRSYIFQIDPIQSLYSAKGIAGNIIPAIATTNAIVAGLQVLQAFHILKSQLLAKEDQQINLKDTCRYTYCLRDKTRKGYYLQPTTLPDPNPECFVCRNAIISLVVNTKEWTLDMLLLRVIKKELGFGEPTLMVGGDIVYEEGDDIDPSEYAGNLSKKLVDLPSGGVGHGSVIRVEDFTQDLEVEMSVSHRDCWVMKDEDGKGKEREDDREEIEKFEIGGTKPTVAASANGDGDDGGEDKSDSAVVTASSNNGEQGKNNADDDDDDEIEVVEADAPTKENDGDSKIPLEGDGVDDDVEIETPMNDKVDSKKRPREEESENETKKAKVDNSNESDDIEVIVID